MNEPTNAFKLKFQYALSQRWLVYTVFLAFSLAGVVLAAFYPSGVLFILVGLVATAVALHFIRRPRLIIYSLSFALAFQISVDAILGAMISPQIVMITAILVPISLLLLENRIGRLLATPYLWLWALYVAIGTLSVARGPSVTNGAQGVWALYRLVWSAPLAYVATFAFLKTTQQVIKAISWISIGATVSSIIAIVQVATSGRLLSGLTTNYKYLGLFPPLPAETTATFTQNTARNLYLTGTNFFRAHGTFLSANGLGVFLATAIFLTWGFAATSKGKKRWYWYSALGLQGIAIAVSFSRSAWLAVVVGIAGIGAWKFKSIFKNQRILINIIGASIITLMLLGILTIRFPTISERFTTIFSPQEVSEVKWRQNIWIYALDQAIQHPFLGTGKTMIPSDEADIKGRAGSYSSHNIFVDLIYQRGFIAFFIYLSLWIIFLYHALKLLRINKLKQKENIILGLLAAGGAFLVSGIGTPSMIYYNLALLSWTLLGLIMSFAYSQTKSSV